MRYGTLQTLGVIAAILCGSGVAASPAAARSVFMATGGITSQPIGHYEFCENHPGECDITSKTAVRVRLTADMWNVLVAVDNKVNRDIIPATDMEVYGREEWWTYPTTEGDCEDVALLKRRDLIEAGWPVNTLLMTVVKRPNGEGHAVLTVLTDRGDLILDNLDGRVLVWNDTPYTFVKRQSQFNTGQWTSIDDIHEPLVGSTR